MKRSRWWLLPVVFGSGWCIARLVPSEEGALPAVADAAEHGTREQLPNSEEGLRAEVLRLRRVLRAEREGRGEREHEWLEFTRAMASLDVEKAPASPPFLDFGGPDPSQAGDPSGAIDDQAPDPDPDAERAGSIRRDLRALLISERVQGMDVLEVGRVANGATGPIVVRLLDDRGRPTGTLACERLRLECSRAARSVSLVFEEGYERYGDQILMFGVPEGLADAAAGATSTRRTGVHRIDLPHVDPQPWIDRLPELFDPADLVPLPDDGRWDRVLVMAELNELLEATTRGGRWRLRELGGVVGDELREVHLVQVDGAGHPIQRIFADRLRIEAEGTGILLMLRDGVSERDGRRAPFLDGRYRVFLPAAPMAVWGQAKIPHAPGLEGERAATEPADQVQAGKRG